MDGKLTIVEAVTTSLGGSGIIEALNGSNDKIGSGIKAVLFKYSSWNSAVGGAIVAKQSSTHGAAMITSYHVAGTFMKAQLANGTWVSVN